jgi:signal recognition particle subunit SRP68
VEEAVKGLAGVVKLYDAVLQSMGQLRGLAIVEEREGVRVGAEGAEAFFHATR